MHKSIEVYISAAVLGSVRTSRKVRSSRVNGRLGGRPSSGLCTERELRSRVRATARERGITDFSSIRVFQDCAVALRRDALQSHNPLDYVLVHRDWWAQLIPTKPYLL